VLAAMQPAGVYGGDASPSAPAPWRPGYCTHVPGILVGANRRSLTEARGDTADDDLARTILNWLSLQEYIVTNQVRRWGGLSQSRCNKPPIPTLALSVLPPRPPLRI